ncbi:hypothetical protein CLV24_11714 [Pontibacter ummariensis]|uniref:Uncharacterized protein n=1 Tax=Pontibacter ummariensis TaxID=1610492 RepID=A0A239IEE3_9BACT|nr:hypothetical protein [Pontibacter ummariensis]PRY09810.1 hypothetical protein CLV24_11714 [Pontibacter ummariensis]SNS91931.1 hypothetical protein SAMN06296052_11714 [Pontibacter ummariensis]
METIKFDQNQKLLTTPEEVVADFCTAPNRDEALDDLWVWLHPVLMDAFREQNNARLDQLVAFYNKLEQLINVFYFTRKDRSLV